MTKFGLGVSAGFAARFRLDSLPPVLGGSVALTDVAHRRVFQRQPGLSAADIPVSGTCSSEIVSVQARAVSAADGSAITGWVTIDSDPQNGTFSGILTVPQGGLYRLEIRSGTDASVTDVGQNTFGVGVVILLYGQSNSQNMTDVGAGIAQDSRAAFYNGTEWTDVQSGSGISALIDGLSTGLNLPIGYIEETQAGAASSYFEPGATGYTNMSAELSGVGDIEFICVTQGEGDADGVFTGVDFKEHWLAAFNGIAGQIGRDSSNLSLFFSSLATFGGDQATISDAEWDDIQSAIYELANEQEGIYFSHSNMDAVRIDSYHYDAASYERSGERFAASILEHLGVNSGGPAFTIGEVVKVDDVTTHVTVVHSDGSDFTPATGITGFDVSHDGVTWISATGARVDTTTIALTHAALGSTSVDDRYIRYQYGTAPDVSNPVRDNSGGAYPLVLSAGRTLADLALPEMTSEAAFAVNENSGTFVAPLTSSRPSSFALSGTDAGDFVVTNDELHFVSVPDTQSPADANGDNVYSVIITPTALDNGDVGASQTVNVTVTGASAKAYSFLGAYQPSDRIPHTHSQEIDIGSATADRFIVVMVAKQNNDSPNPTVTVGGVALTEIFHDASTATPGLYGGIVSSGNGVQTVSVAWNDGDWEDRLMAVWSLTGLESTTPRNTIALESGNTVQTSYTVEAGDFVLLTDQFNSGAQEAPDFTGSTELPDQSVTLGSRYRNADWLVDAGGTFDIAGTPGMASSRLVAIFR